MDWTGREVLVTGGTGFIGSWLVDRLAAEDARVTVLCRDWPAHSRLLDRDRDVRFVTGDVTDRGVLRRVMAERDTDAVFHLAAQSLVGTGVRDPVTTFESNVEGTWTVLDAARRTGVERVVAASSDKAYAPGNDTPFEEGMRLGGTEPYGASKSAADILARAYHETYGLPVGITRSANTYGGGDLNFSRLVPGTVRSVVQGERPVIRSDGEYVRDFLYVEDAVDAFLALAARLDDAAVAGEAFNLGSGEPRSVLEVVDAVLDATDSDLEPEIRDEAEDEVREQYLDAGKARERLGWEPAAGFEEGIARTVDWYEEFLAENPSFRDGGGA